jgi:hypothetical protein
MPHITTLNRHDEDETEVTVEYVYRPGRPEQGPTYDCGGQPAEPPEVEIIRVTANGIQIEPTEAELEAWTTSIAENHEEDEREYEREDR